eukprot:CAMPEP_0177188052 /NCGR_PEP_ID=MMETSP0367-20130122/19524_1 /TAXON_ID=447022 ORGANISM="Scrippsiella hangoei-like, Strain SHHI-4" /NCGR_SAMPLE_ID=MMETSP0367 /ASSEMBLY_ACC=CAM_ASM_000362 /LENGTH=155 /DNA_ID=CAMNT_0018635487 /DNA_START=380 /DNA_END=844 /DNA_ORIENTATION=+
MPTEANMRSNKVALVLSGDVAEARAPSRSPASRRSRPSSAARAPTTTTTTTARAAVAPAWAGAAPFVLLEPPQLALRGLTLPEGAAARAAAAAEVRFGLLPACAAAAAGACPDAARHLARVTSPNKSFSPALDLHQQREPLRPLQAPPREGLTLE